jgi:hypothetical protein
MACSSTNSDSKPTVPQESAFPSDKSTTFIEYYLKKYPAFTDFLNEKLKDENYRLATTLPFDSRLTLLPFNGHKRTRPVLMRQNFGKAMSVNKSHFDNSFFGNDSASSEEINLSSKFKTQNYHSHSTVITLLPEICRPIGNIFSRTLVIQLF